MPDSWTDIPVRTGGTTGDPASSTDQNAQSANFRLLKGGTAATAPTTTLEAEAAKMITEQANIDALQLGDTWNVRGAESGTITAATIAEQKRQVYALSNTADRKLPTTGVLKGWEYVWVNPGTYALTVKSSDGDTVEVIMNAMIKVVALQDTPTDKTHWRIVETKSLTVEKTYVGGQTYNTVVLAVTSASAGFAVDNSAFIPYQGIDGAWHLRGFVRAHQDATATMTVSIAGIDITDYQSAAVQNGYSYFASGGGDLAFTAAYTNCWFSFDFRLDSKPTWAD
jgi:hypothetical protein